jgi:hypothetical protein
VSALYQGCGPVDICLKPHLCSQGMAMDSLHSLGLKPNRGPALDTGERAGFLWVAV